MILYAWSDYRYSGSSKRILHGLFSVYRATLLIDIIWAETSLRSTIQREDALNAKIRTAKKVPDMEIKNLQLDQIEEELGKLRKTRARQERDFYEEESMLPMTSLKRGYNSVKSHPAWYLRAELVEDCIGRGGCCSRDCRCCEKRQLSVKGGKGIGHCTVECICCIHERGSEFTAEEKKDFEDQFDRMLRSDNPAFLLKMANAYFSRPLVWKLKAKRSLNRD